MSLECIRYTPGRPAKLSIINQLVLPTTTEWLPIQGPEAASAAIKSMQVRGAPAIAIVAVLSLAVDVSDPASKVHTLNGVEQKRDYLFHKLAELVKSRPTAVNLAEAEGRCLGTFAKYDGDDLVDKYMAWAEEIFAEDVKTNRAIGEAGAGWILHNTGSPDKCSVLTHCNTGSLATASYGTALGIIRSLHGQNRLERVFAGETRPYNQGARLTVYELVHEKIPVTLITDSMAAAAMARKGQDNKIAAVIVGADRVVRNGDTANKIGTYGLAVLAKFHGVRFVVAAPTTTVDLRTQTGADITIEQRSASELTQISGPIIGQEAEGAKRIQIAAEGCDVWNPAFDVTPAALIDAIVTEKGVFEKGQDGIFDLSKLEDR